VSADEAHGLRVAAPPIGGARRFVPRPVGAAVALIVWLGFSIGLHPLTLPDEGRYVGVAWEMMRSGDWLVPTQDGLPFFHKPPLFYWLTALSMEAFGVNVAAARLAPLLLSGLAMLGLWAATRRRAGAAIANATMVVLATMPFFFAAADYANLDMPVAAWIALTILFAADAALALRDGTPSRPKLVLAWACAALGVLAKGLIGIVLPGIVVVAWLLAMRKPRMILRLVSPLGIVVFLLIAAPWFLLVQARHPGFLHFFFVYQHFERFTASGFNNPQPWWFYVVVLPGLTLPWSLWLVRARIPEGSNDFADRRPWRTLMWVWLAVVVAFFSFPQSKPVGYVMPALFPLAFLIAEPALAAWRSQRAAARRTVVATLGLAVAICLGAVGFVATRYDRDQTALAHALRDARAPGDPVVFVQEYFFDVPLHARLREPVPVIADWHDPDIFKRDNWRRELAEAAPFAPERAAALLVDAEQGFALRCGNAPLWAIVKSADEPIVAALADARRVAASHRAALWRIAPRACPAGEAAPR
jgi:4-amino-4-deoxy-L-arabinose transferase-like glycosyltransferase